MLRLGSWQFGLLAGVLLAAVFLLLAFVANAGMPPAPDGAPNAGQVMGQIMANLPLHVKMWMEMSDYIVGGCFFFVLWRKEAQIYALGPVASHIIFFGFLPFIRVEKLSTGWPALSHWVLIVPFYVLVRTLRNVDLKTGFGVWVLLATAQMAVTLFFDIPAGAMFLYSLLS